MLESDIRREIVKVSQQIFQNGWVANHDGNISIRLGGDRFLITPTAVSKAEVSESNLLVVDPAGKRLSGKSRPFSELGLHLTIYKQRDDVKAVLHSHAPYASALSASGLCLDRPFLAEPVVSLGPSIPTVPFAAPGAQAEAALTPYVRRFDAVILGNHGVLTWGPDLETAYLRMELVEHVAKQAMLAQQLGGPIPIPNDLVESLVAKRKAAGLEPPGYSSKP